ncbi:MAG: LamG domain-containing protein [Candidatus Micrarchaeaceae archaeon]
MKLQSAMEYLSTYGWAILIIAIVMVALFSLGVFNPVTFAPKAQPGSCSVNRNSYGGAELSGVCNGEIPEYVGAFSNGAYIFNSSPTLPVSQPVTITAWINPQQPSSTQGIASWGTPSCGGDVYALYLQSNDMPAAGVGCPGVNPANAPTVGSNSWSFVAIVIGSSGVNFYVDNKNPAFTSAVVGSVSSMNFSIGISNYHLGGGLNYNGEISNVQIYNTSLSPNSIDALYSEGIGGAPIDLENLVGWWPLNGNANDYSGNGNNGQPFNVIYTSGWYSSYSQP